MSYFILDGRTFIKTSRGIIPMVLGGSNNVSDIVFDAAGRRREVREKHWFLMRDDFLELSEDAILKKANEIFCDEEYGYWKSHGKWQYGSQVRRWFARAVRDAAPLEDILAANRGVSLSASVDSFAGEPVVLSTYLYDSDELEAWLDKARNVVKGKESSYINLHFSGDAPLKPVQHNAPNSGAVIMRSGRNRYLKEYERRENGSTIVYTGNPCEAMQFPSVIAASAALGQLIATYNLKYVKVTAKLTAPRPFVLRVMEGTYCGCYVRKTTRSRMYFSLTPEDAQHFLTQREAEAKASRCVGRFTCGKSLKAICVHEA